MVCAPQCEVKLSSILGEAYENGALGQVHRYRLADPNGLCDGAVIARRYHGGASRPTRCDGARQRSLHVTLSIILPRPWLALLPGEAFKSFYGTVDVSVTFYATKSR
mgnify:CR=1 FL=1